MIMWWAFEWLLPKVLCFKHLSKSKHIRICCRSFCVQVSLKILLIQTQLSMRQAVQIVMLLTSLKSFGISLEFKCKYFAVRESFPEWKPSFCTHNIEFDKKRTVLDYEVTTTDLKIRRVSMHLKITLYFVLLYRHFLYVTGEIITKFITFRIKIYFK